MADYKRTTRQCAFIDLPTDLVKAVRDHLKKYALNGEEQRIVACIENTNLRLGDPGWFSRLLSNNKKEFNHTTVILTPDWVIWGFTDTRKLAFALSGRLSQISVQNYEETSEYQKQEDCGLVMNGPANNGSKNGTYIVGLGPEPEAVEFKQNLIKAALRAKE
jgi:hypothetical protein